MIEWFRNFVTPNFGDEDLNRRAFNLNVILTLTIGVMGLGIVAMLLQIGSRPLSYMLPNTLFILVAALVVGFCLHLSRRGRVQAGSTIFVAMMTIACTGAVVVGGTRGALPVILVIPLAAAGVTMSANVSLALSAMGVTALIVIGILERNGVIVVEYPTLEETILLNMFDVGFGLLFVTLSIWLARYSLRQSLQRSNEAKKEADHYRQEAENSLLLEQETRDRLRVAIEEYAQFLDQIGQGNYDVRLPINEEDKLLATLEEELNATVESLVLALEASDKALEQAEAAREEAEAVYRRYLRQSWGDFIQTETASDFKIAIEEQKAETEARIRILENAISQRRMITSTEAEDPEPGSSEMAVPIALRGELIGLMGIRRAGEDLPWSEDERALVEAVADRLAISMESLRLLDETQQRAARERLVTEITTKMRATTDPEAMLQTAVSELRQALRAQRAQVIVQPRQDDKADNDGHMQSLEDA